MRGDPGSRWVANVVVRRRRAKPSEHYGSIVPGFQQTSAGRFFPPPPSPPPHFHDARLFALEAHNACDHARASAARFAARIVSCLTRRFVNWFICVLRVERAFCRCCFMAPPPTMWDESTFVADCWRLAADAHRCRNGSQYRTSFAPRAARATVRASEEAVVLIMTVQRRHFRLAPSNKVLQRARDSASNEGELAHARPLRAAAQSLMGRRVF